VILIMKAGFVYDPIYLQHDTGAHPENSKRLETIITHLEQTGLKERLTLIRPRPATTEELMLVHHESLLAHVKEVAQRGGGWLDPDTIVSPTSYDAALYAAGGVIEAVTAVMGRQVSGAFALVRPPGHHATRRQAMGFCLFNNIAVAAKYALEKLGLERLAIIDFDVHHGNGTQETFYDSSNVLYVSTHQYPHYPGTGRVEEMGRGEGIGTTVNIPLPAGCGDAEYEQVFERIVIPFTRRFRPQFIMVSAGYDGYWEDPLAMMQLTVSGFARIASIIKGLADELCHGRLVFSLEGGYHLAAQAASVKATFEVLLGETSIEDPLGKPPREFTLSGVDSLIKKVRETHGLAS
jgi:acetoin utilization deacetylase AcuC-like enzyme